MASMRQTAILRKNNMTEVRLAYRLLSRPARAEGAWKGGMTEYGVHICVKRTGAEVERVEVEGISCDKKQVLALMERLAAGRVTPVGIWDIVDDFLAYR